MEVGKVYKVTDGDFWMIGRVETIGGLDKDGYYRGRATFLTKIELSKSSSWSYGTKDGWKGRYIQEATPEEIAWLDLCIQENKYVDKPKDFFPQYEIY